MKTLPFIILALWGIALTLGVIGVLSRRKRLLFLGILSALGGLILTLWLKWLLQRI